MRRWAGARRWARRSAFGGLFAVLAALAAERALDVVWPYPLARLRAMEHSTVVEAADGTWLRVVPTGAGERVLPLRWAEAPAMLRAAVLAAEDERFFVHDGVDWQAIGRAFVGNVMAGRVVSGASTLTMQVVRIVEPRPRTLGSKLIEVVRARQLERRLGKLAIADVWLAQVPMGGMLRGFEAAARYWFGRPLCELDLAQAAALVAMVPAPTARSPRRNPALLLARRDALLQRMADAGHVSVAAAAAARRQPLGMAPHAWPWCAPHLSALAVDEAQGPRPLRLRTACDLALEMRLRAVLLDAVLPGDSCAVVVLDRATGAVRALLGSRVAAAPLDASRRRRSLGSTLKPFLFALARELGACTEHGLLDDVPLAIAGWRPANFQRGHAGSLGAADALATSNNVAAVRCLQRVGIAPFLDLLAGLGLPSSAAGSDLTCVLGTGTASPLELARAWQRFVRDPVSLGLSRRSVDWTLAALQRLPMAPGSRGGAMAWKSGTSSGRRDAWCVGVDESDVVVVWLGNADGHGHADLVGVRSAAALLARVAAVR